MTNAAPLQQLLKVGTARAGARLAAAEPPLDALLPALLPAPDAAAPEATLWRALGATDLWERCGYQAPATPDAAANAPQAAAPERSAPCPLRAEAMLAMLLRGAHPASLLREWLHLLRRHGGVLPARFLPELLDAASRQATLRLLLGAVLGERGRWLAGLQPAWSWAAGACASEDPAMVWDTGTVDQRLSILRDWRRRDPDAARQALEQTWGAEPPEHRAMLVGALALGLGPGDEAFLEAALDDRRKEVRTAARELLACLPGSLLAQRTLARLEPLLRIERPLLRAPRLVLTLPEDCDAAMRRNGIGAAPHHGFGEKAGWVIDMLALVDPRIWNERFGRTPRDCLELAERSEFATVFVRGWGLAAARRLENDAAPALLAWLREALLWWIAAAPALRQALPDSLFTLAARQTQGEASVLEVVLEVVLDALPARWALDAALAELLRRLAEPSGASWPAAPSARMLQRLGATLSSFSLLPPGVDWSLRQLLANLALALDPDTAARFAVGWPGHGQLDPVWRQAFDTFFDTLRLRHEMALSFQESA